LWILIPVTPHTALTSGDRAVYRNAKVIARRDHFACSAYGIAPTNPLLSRRNMDEWSSDHDDSPHDR
jgi:hypothetical protein